MVLVSIFQGVARARLDIANVHDRLIQSARSVAEGDQNLLSAAEQVLRAVASLPNLAKLHLFPITGAPPRGAFVGREAVAAAQAQLRSSVG